MPEQLTEDPFRGTFEQNLQLLGSANAWVGHADSAYEMMGRMFGGWTAAVALKAILASAPSERTPAALTVSFLDELIPGRDLMVRPHLIGAGRSVQHWSADVLMVGDDRPVARASAVLTERRPSRGHVEPEMPSVPDPEEELEAVTPPGRAGSQITSLAVSGNPPFGRFDTRSVTWVREKSGRPVDHLQLAFLSDLKAPRSFYWHEQPIQARL